jgi:hypothetical protein
MCTPGLLAEMEGSKGNGRDGGREEEMGIAGRLLEMWNT